MSRDTLPPDPAMPSSSTATNGSNTASSPPSASDTSSVPTPPEKKPDSETPAPVADPPKQSSAPENKQSSIPENTDSAAGADTSTTAISCPVCGLLNRPGELSCARCGSMLVAGAATKKLKEESQPNRPATWPTGEVIVTEQEPITFEIDGQDLLLPSDEVFTVGRMSDIAGDPQPDVDLTPYGAGDKGVSRKHIKIKRKNILVYVADLGSTNGTFLNGRKLIANAERLLRNGDELQLGRLKVRVRF